VKPWSHVLAPGAAAVFLFHGVLARPYRGAVRNYTGKHLALSDFEDFLDELLAAGNPVSLPDVADTLRRDHPLPDEAFAVTFDDGFANNLSVAAPALEARGVPATFYVTTGFVAEKGASWIDRIEYAVDRAEVVSLDLPFLSERAEYRTRDEKVALLESVRHAGKTDRAIDPYELADEIWRQLDVTEMEPDPDLDGKLTWDDVRALDAHELFTVGGHGATHRILEHLPQQQLEDELERCLTALGRELGRPVEHFSYPEGLSGTYSDRVVRELVRGGVRSAVTAEPGPVRRGADPFLLPRFLVA